MVIEEYVNCWLRHALYEMKLDIDRYPRFYPPGMLNFWLLPDAPVEEAALWYLSVWCDENVTKDVADRVAKEIKAVAELLMHSHNDYAEFLDIYLNHYYHFDPLEINYYVEYPDP